MRWAQTSSASVEGQGQSSGGRVSGSPISVKAKQEGSLGRIPGKTRRRIRSFGLPKGSEGTEMGNG